MYFLLGACLILGIFFAANVIGALAADLAWRLFAPRLEQPPTARRRADFIFSLRVLPAAAALIFTAFFLFPAYVLYEPRATKEPVGVMLAAAAAFAAAGIFTAATRLFKSYLATRRLVAEWMKRAEPLDIAGVSVPAYRIRHRFPIVAVVGVLRPRIFVAEQIFSELETDEFQAVVAHEAGHLAAGDNLRRTLINVCRDLLIFPLGRRLDKAWAASAESGADEFAVRSGDDRTAINLAAALVKIAKIVPSGVTPAMPAGGYLIEAQTAKVAFRVNSLLQNAGRGSAESKIGGALSPLHYGLICLLAILPFAADRELLRAVHLAAEFIVNLQR